MPVNPAFFDSLGSPSTRQTPAWFSCSVSVIKAAPELEELLLDEEELLDDELDEELDELELDELDEPEELDELDDELVSPFSPPQPVRINPSAIKSAVLFINPH